MTSLPSSPPPQPSIPTLDDILTAHQRLMGVAHWTPIITSRLLDELAGCRLYLKAENLQKGGAFKIRGAYNKVASLTPQQRAAGVIAFSSGNHAQGVALAARYLGAPAVVVMPEDAPAVKQEAVAAYGARIVLKGTTSAEREAEARRLAQEHGYSVIPAFDDPDIVAGQGTVALEVLKDVPDLDALIVPVGGGGLISGCALAVKAARPKVRVIGVEPVGASDAYQSLRAGRVMFIQRPQTMADGLRAQRVGQLNWEIIRHYVDDIVLVEEEAIAEAMRLLLTRTKLLAEPSGAVTVAAVLSGKIPVAGQKVVAVVSGGNVDLHLLSRLLAS